MCNCFFHYFKKLDGFDIPISFRHKREDTYSTWIGGLITFLIVGFALGFCIAYFIPFVKKENYSLYYYSVNLDQTEKFNLAKSKSSLAFGLECSGSGTQSMSIEDLLELKAKYIYYIDKGKTKKEEDIEIHTCRLEDFYSDVDMFRTLNRDILDNLKCLDDLDRVIKNRYQDRFDNFTYFQIDIYGRENDINASTINNYILDNDCKVELYYIDVKIEVDDFDEPIKPFLSEVFIQLNPDFNSRMNAFFMNSYFESNNDLFFETKSSEIVNSLFSRTEQYFLHRDINNKRDSYAKIYIRADTKNMIIKRTYQTLTEFFAVTFSFWEDLFLLCSFVITAYNKFCLNYSIEKKLFYFKEKKNSHFDVTKNSAKIKELINSTDSFSDNTIIQNSEKNELLDMDITRNSQNISQQNINKKNNNNVLLSHKYTMNRFKLVPKKLFDFFNFFDCNCCRWASLDSQAALYSKAEDIIENKLDVSYYLRTIFTFDIYKSIFMDDKQEILKFLSMPIISSNKGEKEDNYQYHEIYTDKDFNALDEEVSQLLKKPPSGEVDRKLLNLVNQRLNELYY